MNYLLTFPWVESSIGIPFVGALIVAFCRPPAAFRWCLALTFLTLGGTLLAWVAFVQGGSAPSWSPFRIDELSAPMLPLVALLHLLTALATARTKMGRVPFAGLLLGNAIRLATFASLASWLLVALLVLGVVPPGVEIASRKRSGRIYWLHMGLFSGLLVTGWALQGTEAAPILLLLAVLIRAGTLPAHGWVVDLFERASFATALLVVTPLLGVYAAVRLVLPIAPDWLLQTLGIVSLMTAVYAAGLALVQREARRFFAYLTLSHGSLVLVGLELHTPISLTGSLCLWVSLALALCGLGLTLRALEARFGRMSLADYRGLYEHVPALGVFFLLTGLASVGFPGTLGFIAAELLVDGAVEASPGIGVIVGLTAALNGIAIVRVYLLLFTGKRVQSDISGAITLRERVAVIVLAALLLGGGLYPHPGVASRYRAAIELLGSPPPAAHGEESPGISPATGSTPK